MPRPLTRVDGGWCARACQLDYTFSPYTPETVGAVIEVRDAPGALVATNVNLLGTPPDDEWTTPDLPDSGFFRWRVQGFDDAGVRSLWSTEGTFRVDGIAPPPAPATVTVELDGGFLRITTAPITDLESGAYELFASVGGVAGPKTRLDGVVRERHV